MWKNIKSLYTLKMIFSYVNEKRKLNLIQYNNNLKNANDVNIFNYMYYKEGKKNWI